MKLRFGLVGVGVAATLSLAPATWAATPPRATTLEKVSSVVQPGVVYLETTYRGAIRDPVNKSWLRGGSTFTAQGSCSGFFVNPDGHFVTAGHCVDKAEGRSILIAQAARWSFENERWAPGTTIEDVLSFADRNWKVVSAETPARAGPDREVAAAYGVDVGGLPTGKALPARVQGVRAFERGDVALAKVEVSKEVAVLQLAPDAQVNVGTEVVAVGYPASVDLVTDQTFDPSFKEGSVSSERTIKGGLVKVYEISSAVSGGMSGGPTVDLRGRVIGVNSFGIRGEPQAFNFVSPVSEIVELLRDKGVENQLGSTNRAYRAGLTAYYAGDREEALAQFDRVLGEVREHELAQEFRSKALRLPKEESGFPFLPVGLGVLLLGALAAGFLLLRKRRTGGTPAAATPPRRSPGSTATAAVQADPRAESASWLEVTGGPLAGKRFPITGPTVVGRGDVEISIDDQEISRQHARFEASNGGVGITDLRSANGTTVNGRAIDGSTRLSDGDVVGVGGTTIAIHLAAAPADEQRTAMKKTPVPPPPMPVLVISDGPNTGERFKIEHEVVLGRANTDIVLQDPEVSRRHASVKPMNGAVQITDLESANGTAVNGVKIHAPKQLGQGDVITLGNTSMSVELGTAPHRVPQEVSPG